MNAVSPETITTLTNYVFPNDIHVHWSLMIVMYPYVTGVIAGAFIVSSLYHVFHDQSLKPVARFSLLFAFAFLVVATWPLLNHLGHPERALLLMITPHPTSAMAGFGYIYNLYALLLTLEILFIYRPIAVAIKNKSRGLKKLLYTVLALGSSRISPQALELDRKIIHFLAAIGIPLACILHGYVGFIFGGVKANPTWSTPLMPLIFLLSAAVSGIAGIIVAYLLIRRLTHRSIDMTCLRHLVRYLWGVLILCFTFEMLEIFTLWYMQTAHWHMIEGLILGPTFWTYWIGQVALCSGIPLVFLGLLTLFPTIHETLYKILAFLCSCILLVQVFLMRWNVVIGGQLMSKSERGYTYFHLEWLEKEGILAALIILIAPLVILFVLSRVFPMWQDEEMVKAEG